MYQGNPINPYKQNFDIMRKFFSKPIVLIIAIVCTAGCVLSIAADLISSFGAVSSALNSSGASSQTTSTSVSVDVISILTAIAFYMLYFMSRSDKPYVDLKKPSIILQVTAILDIISFAILMVALIAICSIFTLVDFAGGGYIIAALLCVMPLVIFTLLQNIALLILTGTFKKNISSIYLKKSGAVFLGVTSIAIAAIYVVVSVVLLIFYKDIYSYLMSLIPNLPESVNISIGSESSLVAQAIVYLFGAFENILLAVFAFSFSSYISKVSDSITEGAPQYEYNPVLVSEDFDEPRQNMNTPQPPINFEPNQAFNNQGNGANQPPEQNPYNSQVNPYESNPYAQAQNGGAYNQPQSVVCPVCGKICASNAVFCGNCGYRLK